MRTYTEAQVPKFVPHTYRGEGHAVVEVAEDRHGDRARNLAELNHVHEEEDDVHHHEVAAHDHDDEL